MSGVFNDITVLSSFYFWASLFFVSAAILSFRDVASIKIVQLFLASMRFFTILLMIIGCIIVMSQQGFVYSLTPTAITNGYYFKAFNFD